MADSFDLIVKGGTVVNHDGIGVRDIGIRNGRIAALGNLSAASAGEVIDAAGPARAARRDRQPGAFPRAGPRAQGGPGDRQPRRCGGRRHGRVRDAQHQAADHLGRDAGRQGAPRAQPHVLRLRLLRRRHAREHRRHSRRWSGSRARPASRCSWAPPPATCWWRTSLRSTASSPASRAAPPSTPRTRHRLKARMHLRRPGDPSSHPGVARRGGGADRHAAPGAPGREARKRVHVLHVSTAEEMAFLADHKDWASVEVTPHHLTLVAPRLLPAPRHLRADEPAGARRAASRRRSGRRSPSASSTCWAPTTRRTRARRRSTPTPRATPA